MYVLEHQASNISETSLETLHQCTLVHQAGNISETSFENANFDHISCQCKKVHKLFDEKNNKN